MKTYKRLFLIILALASFALLVSCAASPATTSGSPGATTTVSQATTVASAQGNSVSIENFAFAPDTLTIKAGSTVVWTNNDSASHNIKIGDTTSPMMAKGQTFEMTFDTKGTFDYICGVHPSMKGKIIVE